MTDHNSIQDSTGFWVTRLARSMEQDFEKRLQSIGITRGAYAVLSAIYHDQQLTPRELASFLGVHGAAVTRHLDRIEQKGLIRRSPSAADRRSIDISMTREGVKVVKQGRAGSKATNKKFTAGLAASDIDQLHAAIRTMLANADEAIANI